MTENQIFDRLNFDAESIKANAKHLSVIDGRIEVLLHKIEAVNKQIQDDDAAIKSMSVLSTDFKLFAQKFEHLTELMNSRLIAIEEANTKNREAISSLEARPGKLLMEQKDKIVMNIITSLASGAVGALIAYLGLR